MKALPALVFYGDVDGPHPPAVDSQRTERTNAERSDTRLGPLTTFAPFRSARGEATMTRC